MHKHSPGWLTSLILPPSLSLCFFIHAYSGLAFLTSFRSYSHANQNMRLVSLADFLAWFDLCVFVLENTHMVRQWVRATVHADSPAIKQEKNCSTRSSTTCELLTPCVHAHVCLCVCLCWCVGYSQRHTGVFHSRCVTTTLCSRPLTHTEWNRVMLIGIQTLKCKV